MIEADFGHMNVFLDLDFLASLKLKQKFQTCWFENLYIIHISPAGTMKSSHEDEENIQSSESKATTVHEPASVTATVKTATSSTLTSKHQLS